MQPASSNMGLKVYLLTQSSLEFGHFVEHMKNHHTKTGDGSKPFIFSFFDFETTQKIKSQLIDNGVKSFEIISVPNFPRKEDICWVARIYNWYLTVLIDGPSNTFSDYATAINDMLEKINYDGRYHTMPPIIVRGGHPALDYTEQVVFPCCKKHFFAFECSKIPLIRADGCQCDSKKRDCSKTSKA